MGSSMRSAFQDVHRHDDDHAGDASEHDRAGRRHPVAGAGDRHEPGEEAVHREAHVPGLRLRKGVEHRGEPGGAGRERRVGGDAADALEVHRRQRAARVEPVPAEPQDEAADGRDRQVVRHHGAAAVALELPAEARAEHDRAGQRDESADAVHHRGTGEIVEAHAERREEVAVAAHRRQPAVRPPGPVPDDRVDEARDAEAVDQVADEAGAADHGARRDGRAGVGEGVLEEPEGQERHAARAVGRGNVLQEEELGAEEGVPEPNMNAKPQA